MVRVKLSREEVLKRKREYQRKYDKKKNEEKRSQVRVLAESTKRGRVCREPFCNRGTALTSYYFCAEHREAQEWGDDTPVYTIIEAGVV